jgi:hypothetical protein
MQGGAADGEGSLSFLSIRPGHSLPAPSSPRISFISSPLLLMLPDRNAYKSPLDERVPR